MRKKLIEDKIILLVLLGIVTAVFIYIAAIPIWIHWADVIEEYWRAQ